MSNKEGQNAYHEARSIGHTKSDARMIRNNWKSSSSSSDDDNNDNDSWVSNSSSYDKETELNRKYYESLDPSHPDYRDLD
jgi:hypothetical protein